MTAPRVSALRAALATRVVVADGATGTMLQAQDPTLEDFESSSRTPSSPRTRS